MNEPAATYKNHLAAIRNAFEYAGVILIGEFGVTSSADNFAEARLGA